VHDKNSIFSRNLDEFFEIRVASLIQKISLMSQATGPEGLPLVEVLKQISKNAHEAVEEQYKILNYTLLPQLQGFHFIQHGDILEKHKEWIKEYFFKEVQPVVTPISLDPAHPFPRLVNKSLNFIVTHYPIYQSYAINHINKFCLSFYTLKN
ncbi:polyphosphate kinase middle domain protein, partial [Acinetobacter baumannii 25691_8]